MSPIDHNWLLTPYLPQSVRVALSKQRGQVHGCCCRVAGTIGLRHLPILSQRPHRGNATAPPSAILDNGLQSLSDEGRRWHRFACKASRGPFTRGGLRAAAREARTMSTRLNRRDFSRAATAASAAARHSTSRVLGAGDQVRLGFIGVGNRGCQLLKGFLAHPDAKIVALCDVYAPYLNADYARVDPRFASAGKAHSPDARGSRRRRPGQGLPGHRWIARTSTRW